MALNQAALASGLFDDQDIKTRALICDHFVVGTVPENRGFVHLVVAMIARPEHVERSLSEALGDALQEALAGIRKISFQICVEVTHVDATSYVKRVLP